MKGWVYVITNRSMRGLVKIGYTLKEPRQRAKDLNHTGNPHPYVVEYEVLVDEPYQIEQRAHKILASINEAKEWFRCKPEQATEVIRQIVAGGEFSENNRLAGRAESAARQELYKRRAREERALIARNRIIEARLSEHLKSIDKKFDAEMKSRFKEIDFWSLFVPCYILCLIFFVNSATKGWVGVALIASLPALLAAGAWQQFLRNKMVESAPYKELLAQRERDREAARSSVALEE